MKAHAPIIKRDVERDDESSTKYISLFRVLATVGAELGTAVTVGAAVGDCIREK
jgi:hypothetical protein